MEPTGAVSCSVIVHANEVVRFPQAESLVDQLRNQPLEDVFRVRLLASFGVALVKFTHCQAGTFSLDRVLFKERQEVLPLSRRVDSCNNLHHLQDTFESGHPEGIKGEVWQVLAGDILGTG